MNRFATLRNARLLQLLGLLLALIGLAGFWLTRGVERTDLSDDQRDRAGIEAGDFHASFVVAGRDVFYEGGMAEPIYGEGGEIVCWSYTGATNAYGSNTDTILYVDINNEDVTMFTVPRDIFMGASTRRMLSAYQLGGGEELKRQVSNIIGLPIDYYAVINLDIFQNLVDDLGGVEVNVPVRMYHRDCAAGYTIDLQPGAQVLDGEAASHFVRYRDLVRGDIDRLDNVKLLAQAMLARVKELNLLAVGRLPALADTFLSDVETNATPADLATLLQRLLPNIADIRLSSATLPVLEIDRNGALGLEVDPIEMDRFLASSFGGTPRLFTETPEATVLITNRSGVPGLERWYRDRLVGLGVPEEQLLLREASRDPSPTRVVATAAAWSDADYYATLLHADKQQIDRLPAYQRTGVDLELVLGVDAHRMTASGDVAAVGDAP
jgi:LCP family protein required for cell wall assembly